MLKLRKLDMNSKVGKQYTLVLVVITIDHMIVYIYIYGVRECIYL